MKPTDYLPANLRDAADKLPSGQQHTVLSLPDAGEGHNAGLLSIATTCYKMGVSMDDTLSHLREIYDSDRIDYRTAPARAVNRVWQHEGAVPVDAVDEALEPQEELLLRFRRTLASSLLDSSPGNVKTHPKDIIRALFEADDVINIQRTGFEAGTLLKCSDLPDRLHEFKFLNPSTFKRVAGIDAEQPDGSIKRMTRCNANVQDRPYMLLECDYKSDDPNGPAKVERFTTFALTLAEFAPLTLAVDTGNKSIHFWYDTRKTKPKIVAKFFALARLHGADRQLAVRSQIARMPNVSSSGEGRDAQTVLYFDPKGEKHPDGWDLAGFEKYIHTSKQLDFYYSGSGKYWMQSNTDRWINLNRQSLTKQLAVRGFRETKLETEAFSPVDALIAGFETDKSIEAVLSGASGKHAGYYEDNGFNYLVQKSPNLIKPRKGDWSTIRKFLEHMLRADQLQTEILHGLLSSSVRDFRNGGRRESCISPCQALHIAGDNDSGKSFFNKFILPALFGGRWANAEAYFKPNAGEHNSEMFGAELLILDDTSVLGTSHRERKVMTEKIKEITVGSGQAYRGMYQDRITSRPWWRLIRMMNTTPDDLATLPLLERGAEDKWILLYAMGMDGGSVDKTAHNWFDPWKDQIVGEIPAYLHYLLREHRIGQAAKDPSGRYAVRSYKNSSLIESLREDSLETYLLHRIDSEASDSLFGTHWCGTSGHLYDILAEVGSQRSQQRFAKTCPSPRVLSSQLKLLEKAFPERFRYSNHEDITPRKINGNYYWRLLPDVNPDDCF